MKKLIIHFVILANILLLGSCNKKDNEGNKLPYLGGRVVLINSDTPVPNAVVRFAKWANTCLTCPMSYIELGTDTTDENGRFEIPTNTDATMAIAFGVDSIFDRQSAEGNVTSYIEKGGELRLSLVPPAWIKVSALDVEPLNPEIEYLSAYSSTAIFTEFIPLSNFPYLWKVDGNISQYVGYAPIYADSIGNPIHFLIPPPTPFDTTEYVIEY